MDETHLKIYFDAVDQEEYDHNEQQHGVTPIKDVLEESL
jgi:hypothetical protein